VGTNQKLKQQRLSQIQSWNFESVMRLVNLMARLPSAAKNKSAMAKLFCQFVSKFTNVISIDFLKIFVNALHLRGRLLSAVQKSILGDHNTIIHSILKPVINWQTLWKKRMRSLRFF